MKVEFCCATVVDRGRASQFSGRCRRQGTVLHQGLWYCKQHDPVVVMQRDAARAERHKARLAEMDRKWRMERHAEQVLEALEALVRDVDGLMTYESVRRTNEQTLRRVRTRLAHARRLVEMVKGES